MRYSLANLGQAEPERYVPAGPTDCSNAVEYRKAVDNAADRIAYYQAAVQQAAEAGNRQAVDRAAAGADLANRDWSAWSRVLKNCDEITPASAASAASSEMGGLSGVAIALVLVGVGVAVATVVGRPDLVSFDFLKSKGR